MNRNKRTGWKENLKVNGTRLATTKAIAAVVTEVAIASANGDRATVIATRTV